MVWANIEWMINEGLTDYAEALSDMESRAASIRVGAAKERVWLIEHPSLYTSGTSAESSELLEPHFPVHASGRGGRYTYHGPGQRVVYVQLDLTGRGRNVRVYIEALEFWIVAALADCGVDAWSTDDRIGVWTKNRNGREAKIGAIGVRIKRWVTLHGFAVNIAPDLSHFCGIIPCGLSGFPVTSLADIGAAADIAQFDRALYVSLPAFLDRLS